MGVMPGHRQVTLYIEPSTYEQAVHVAKMLGEPVYVFINKALKESINNRTTPEQRKAIELITASGVKSDVKPSTNADTPKTEPKKKKKPAKKTKSSR